MRLLARRWCGAHRCACRNHHQVARAPVRVATSIVVVRHAREGSERRRAARVADRGNPCTQGIGVYLCGMMFNDFSFVPVESACMHSGMSLQETVHRVTLSIHTMLFATVTRVAGPSRGARFTLGNTPADRGCNLTQGPVLVTGTSSPEHSERGACFCATATASAVG